MGRRKEKRKERKRANVSSPRGRRRSGTIETTGNVFKLVGFLLMAVFYIVMIYTIYHYRAEIDSLLRMSRKEKMENRKGILGWVIFTVVYAIFLMWVSGMAQAYFPTLVSPGGGQYFDVPIGIIIIGSSFYLILAAYLFKNKFSK
jgi:sterol desaturase/sphingolipid hydroxylase (fatty acid hydroxylase superfamily)